MVSDTSGVTLEHEPSGRDGGLDIHWDVVEQRCGVGVAELAFGRFVNALQHAAVADPDGDHVEHLAELQESYYVAWATRPESRRAMSGVPVVSRRRSVAAPPGTGLAATDVGGTCPAQPDHR